MKNISIFFSAIFTFSLISIVSITAFSQIQDKSNFHYWQNKMEDPDQNYNQLIQEFENYCTGKDIEELKSTGYKHFKRWQYAREGMTGPDGKLLPASYFLNELENFKQQYGSKSIVGDWDFLGPDVVPIAPGSLNETGIGRIACITFHPTDLNTIYVGAHTGGIWKTTTGGDNWTNLNTDQIPSLGVSAICVHPSNPNIILIGTGDRDADYVDGYGIWKSINGGSSWTQITSAMEDILVSEILVSPDNEDILLAAAEDGVYVSTDIGDTWVKTTGIDRNVKDMVFKPGNSSVVYATGHGEFYKSTTLGLSWYRVTSGLFTTSRMTIGVTPDAPDKVFIFATRVGNFEGFYVSTNSGSDFTKIPTSDFAGEKFGSFCIALGVDPTNENNMFAGMQAMFRTTNGGSSWSKISDNDNVHADQHAIEFSPFTNDVYIGCDGGLYHSSDGGINFSNISDGLEITQVCRLAVSETNPDIFLAGLQDNGTIVPANGIFHRVRSQDGMTCAIDYTDDQYMYASDQHTHIHRSTSGNTWTGDWENISGDITEDKGWFRPYILDKDDPNTMFAGFQNVWKSNNVKTTNADDVSWVNISNGKITFDDKKIELMEQSTADGNIMYISLGDGVRMYRTDNAYDIDADWTEIVKPGAVVKCIETHPTNPDIVYVVTYWNVYQSDDRGANWTMIDDNLPGIPLKSMLYHIGSNDGLYVGTLAGVYYKEADMNDWALFKPELPMVPIVDMKIIYSTTPDRLVVGTWGRGVWETGVMPVMKPDLSIPIASATIVNQTEVTISLLVHNEDNMSVAENYHLGYYLSDDNIIDQSDYLVGEDFISSHGPGSNYPENIVTDIRFIEPEIPVGTYYIGAYVDNQSDILETNEANNNITCVSQVSVPSPPGQPLNVEATDGTYGSKIVITWDEPASQFNLYYKVYRNTVDNSGTASPIGENWIDIPPFEDTDVLPGQDYYYWVRASDTHLGLRPGALSSSNNGWLTLSPPTNVEATDGNYDNRVVISWDSPIGATHFKVWRNTSSDVYTAEPLSTGWTPNNSFIDWTAATITTYFYWVKSAMSASGDNESLNYSSSDIGYVAFTSAPVVNATDGLYHDRIEVTWNGVPGASYYQLYKSFVDDPVTASPSGGWQTETFQTITSGDRGILIYFWVKAAVDQYGGLASGFGAGDSGWRSFEPPEDVQASDGISTDYVEITWDNNIWTNYYQIYRYHLNNPYSADTVSNWIDEDPGLTTTFIDSTAHPGHSYFYWVKCANDPEGELASELSLRDDGWRKLSKPDINATKGGYADKVRISWDYVVGAGAYRVMRNVLGTPWIVDTLTNWTSSMFFYDDYAVSSSETYQYQVKAADNILGDRPSSSGNDFGFPGECGNLTDDPNYRSINFHGTILEITQRVINNGSFPILLPEQVSYALDETPPVAGWNYYLGKANIPPLAVGAYYDVSFVVDLDTIIDAPVPHGTWTIVNYMPTGGSGNCQSNPYDDYLIWNHTLEYTDALYGIYTIGGTDPDFPTFNNAFINLMNRGISDHVIFNVRPGIYYEQIAIPENIGSGPDKTITFQTEPNKADNAELNFTSNEGNFIIQFDGCSYITIQNLDITSPGYSNNVSSYGRVFEFINNAHHISILNNTITGSADDSYISSDNAVIYSENSKCNDIIIQDNEILNGSWGIYLAGVGAGSNLSSGLEITGNTIQNFMYTGIKLQYQENPQVIGNTIQFFTSNITQCFGIDMESIEGGFKIDKNQVIMEPCGLTNIGIALQDCKGSLYSRGLVSNNFVAITSSGNPLYGMTFFNGNSVDIYHNSINITGTNFQDHYCINLDCSDNPDTYDINILNNVFSNQAGGYTMLIGDNAITHNYITSSDYNDLYSTGSYIGLYGSTNQISDLTTWQTVSGMDQNSISYDPEFFSDTDLHTLSYALDNNGYSYYSPVLDDIDGEPRNGDTPDIGADEYTPPTPSYDAAVSEIIEPVSSKYLTDQETITIVIENKGTEPISNFQISYSIDGGSPITEMITDAILASETYNFTFATIADFSLVGSYEIIGTTLLTSDQRPTNNEYSTTIEHLPPTYCAPLYTYDCFNSVTIDDFYLNTIQHEATSCFGNNYGNFIGISTDLTQGQSYLMEISINGGYTYVSLWIDFDNNTDFESSEKLVTDLYCHSYNTIYSATINIPVSAIPGPHRMRVRAVHNETGFNACDEYLSGEVHDYTVNITSGGSLNVDLGPDMRDCYGTPITLSANTTGGTTPYNYLWSTGETTSSIIAYPVYDSIFSIIVTDNLGYSAYDEIEIFMKENPVAMASSNSPVCEESDISLFGSGNYFGHVENRCISNCEIPSYCSSKPIDTEGCIVEEVIFGDINNNTMDICGDYSDYTTMKTTVALGDTLDLFVTLADCDNFKAYHRGGKAYIDWNRDGDFKENSEMVGLFGITEFGDSYDTTVIIPSNAVLGKTILRVVTRATMIIDSVKSCGTNYWMGETEDYTIEIIERLDNFINTYSWIGPDTYSSLEQNPIIPSSTSDNDGTYTLSVTDGNGCISTDDTEVVVVINPTANAGSNDIICEIETYSLNGQATNYSSILWSSSGNGSFNNDGIIDPIYTPSNDDINSGEVTLSLLAYASAPCSNTALSTMTLTITKQPVVFAGNDATINEGENYILSEATALEYTSIEWSTAGTGSFDDSFALNPEYTPGTSETGVVSLILTGYANSPCSEQKDTIDLEIIPYAGFDLDIKVLLDGSFNGIDMNTHLNSILPLGQPYSSSPWNYFGTETTTLIPNPNIVDWVLVELRDATDASNATPGTMIGQQAAFLLKDGSVVDLDGSSILSFDHSIIQSLFVVVWHRNHVGIISANPLVRIGNIYSYDFTTDELQVLGGSLGYKELIPGTWGMVGGDANANGAVNSTDKGFWDIHVGEEGYLYYDFNMDSQVDNQDKNDIWLNNQTKVTQVPY